MTKVKICGLKNQTDIKCINTLSPDFAGFVMFFEKSHRNISVQTAQELLALLDKNIKPLPYHRPKNSLSRFITLGLTMCKFMAKSAKSF